VAIAIAPRSDVTTGETDWMARRWWVESDEAWTTNSTGRDWHGKLLGSRVLRVAALPDSEDCVAVLDWMDRPPGVEVWHPFANLIRATPSGEVVWTADAPDHDLRSWTAVAIEDGIVVANAWSHRCVVDPDTGRIISSEFTK
jgi:hypothetical protein